MLERTRVAPRNSGTLHITAARLAPMKPIPAPNYQQLLWRLRADETRKLAQQMRDPEAKRTVLKIADRCDRLVELIVLVQAATLPASLMG
jgi:hypothetical protein